MGYLRASIRGVVDIVSDNNVIYAESLLSCRTHTALLAGLAQDTYNLLADAAVVVATFDDLVNANLLLRTHGGAVVPDKAEEALVPNQRLMGVARGLVVIYDLRYGLRRQ